ncbi:MFS transporter [Crenobacter sp. SG2303]|uniref:Uncharacterized MFS-type transporter QU481_09720 n=1 Tax=Crenobacter oryzisoli TaxID=3056844 RepID=A0ABT7XN04_9NEIS|nr:MFS transporter [Crenobacter sp. SG2303]MDN0075165.1 MFS transporter [Crenobacter sp. SG2303]
MPDPFRYNEASPRTVARQIVSIVFFNFIGYLSVGVTIAVVPVYVHADLGFGSVVAGLAVSSQYVATLLSRAYAGRLCDTRGPKFSVLNGLVLCTASGWLLLAAVFVGKAAVPSLVLLVVARLLLGAGESLVTTGTITWAIGRVGAAHTAKVISWNGITSYGAIALGAPLGVALARHWGFASLGVFTLAISLGSWLLARRMAAVPTVHGDRLPFGAVFWRMLPFGLCLALGSIGFGAISTFVTLFYASRHWPDAALALSLFGGAFVLSRLLFVGSIGHLGGYRVALLSFAVEAVGLALLWGAVAPSWAFAGAALTGFGFALVFPALASEAVRRVPDSNRGTALGAYALFLDLSLGVTGPAAGLIANRFGYGAVYLAAALAALWALGLCGLLRARSGRELASACV